MRHSTSLLILFSLLISHFLCSAKPVFGPIGVAEKHRIAKELESEQKSLQILTEEHSLLEKVVETLSQEIEDKEAHIEKLRSYTRGRNGIAANLVEDYRSNFKNGPQFRPGR